jgi:hypothetical protein
MNIFLLIVIVVVIVLILGAVVQAFATRRERAAYPPPGQLVDAGGHRLHLLTMGEGSPTVILDAGMVSFSSN